MDGRPLSATGRERLGSVNAMFPEIGSLGKMLILLGIVVILLGGLLLLVGKVPFLGRLPGDIVIRRESWSFYFPLTTSILISLLLTLLFWLFGRR